MEDQTGNPGFLQGQWPMIAQYLAAAGEDIGAGRPLGSATNRATMQNIQSQNYVKMLKGLLAGGGKIAANAQDITIKAPIGAFNQQSSDPEGAAMSAPANMAQIGSVQPQAQGQPKPPTQDQSTELMSLFLGGAAGNANPTSSPLGNISAADLAGLTTQDISQAMHMKLGQDEMSRREALDIAREKFARDRMALETIKAIKSGEGKTNTIKEYEYAVQHGYDRSFNEFKNVSSSAGIEDYNLAKSQGYKGTYLEWKLKLANAAKSSVNVNLGEKMAIKEAEADVKDSRYYTDPNSGVGADLDKHLQRKDIRDTLFQYDPNSVEYKKAKAEEVEKFYEQRFKSGGVKVVERRVEGNDFVWKVKLPNGKVKEVRHGN